MSEKSPRSGSGKTEVKGILPLEVQEKIHNVGQAIHSTFQALQKASKRKLLGLAAVVAMNATAPALANQNKIENLGIGSTKIENVDYKILQNDAGIQTLQGKDGKIFRYNQATNQLMEIKGVVTETKKEVEGDKKEVKSNNYDKFKPGYVMEDGVDGVNLPKEFKGGKYKVLEIDPANKSAIVKVIKSPDANTKIIEGRAITIDSKSTFVEGGSGKVEPTLAKERGVVKDKEDLPYVQRDSIFNGKTSHITTLNTEVKPADVLFSQLHFPAQDWIDSVRLHTDGNSMTKTLLNKQALEYIPGSNSQFNKNKIFSGISKEDFTHGALAIAGWLNGDVDDNGDAMGIINPETKIVKAKLADVLKDKKAMEWFNKHTTKERGMGKFTIRMGGEDYILFLEKCSNPLIAIEDMCFTEDGKLQKLTYLNPDGSYTYEFKVIRNKK